MDVVRAAAPPGESRGARAEGSSGSLTLCRGRWRHRAWTTWRVLGCRAPAERASGVSKRGPRGHGSGVRVEVVSPRRRKERAGGYARCLPRSASWGSPSCPSPPEAFLGVKTSRPESLLWPVTPLSRTQALRTPLKCCCCCFGGGEVIKTRPWDLPPRTFKSLLENEIRWL